MLLSKLLFETYEPVELIETLRDTLRVILTKAEKFVRVYRSDEKDIALKGLKVWTHMIEQSIVNMEKVLNNQERGIRQMSKQAKIGAMAMQAGVIDGYAKAITQNNGEQLVSSEDLAALNSLTTDLALSIGSYAQNGPL